MLRIPASGQAQALARADAGRKAQKVTGLADVGLGMTDVSGPERPIHGFGRGRLRLKTADLVANQIKQLVERGAFAHGHVVNLAGGFFGGRQRGQDIGLRAVVNVTEIP